MEQKDWVAQSERVAASMVSESQGAMGEWDALVALLAKAYRRGAEDGLDRAREIIRGES